MRKEEEEERRRREEKQRRRSNGGGEEEGQQTLAWRVCVNGGAMHQSATLGVRGGGGALC